MVNNKEIGFTQLGMEVPMSASKTWCVSSLDHEILPDLSFRTSVKSGRTWSVASTCFVALVLKVSQGWGGSVEARPLIQALNAHYKEIDGGDGPTSSDGWALRYINVGRGLNIAEVSDEDVNGLITIKEANNLTDSRPLDWRWVPGNFIWW